jgi:hypothetical protein
MCRSGGTHAPGTMCGGTTQHLLLLRHLSTNIRTAQLAASVRHMGLPHADRRAGWGVPKACRWWCSAGLLEAHTVIASCPKTVAGAA